MNFRSVQPNFSRGELAPQLYGRFDVDAWQSSVRQARNVLILKYGGLTKRPGFQLVAEVLDKSDGNRLIPFEFSDEQTYALEFGQGYMAPLALGGRVLETELAITGISQGSNAQITAAYHGYSVGDQVWLSDIDGEMGDVLNNRAWTVLSVVDANNFTIDARTTDVGAFSGSEGGITRSGAPDPDPTPPVVPAPTPAPTPPDIGGGGGGGWSIRIRLDGEAS